MPTIFLFKIKDAWPACIQLNLITFLVLTEMSPRHENYSVQRAGIEWQICHFVYLLFNLRVSEINQNFRWQPDLLGINQKRIKTLCQPMRKLCPCKSPILKSCTVIPNVCLQTVWLHLFLAFKIFNAYKLSRYHLSYFNFFHTVRTQLLPWTNCTQGVIRLCYASS